MLVKIIEFFYEKLRKRTFHLDSNISSFELINIIFDYGYKYFKGFYKGYMGVSFGRGVQILGKSKLLIFRGSSIGDFCNLNALGHQGIKLGTSCSIGSYSILHVSGTLSSIGNGITLGNNVGIGDFSHIGGAGGVHIGDDTIVGAYFSVHPENHIFSDVNLLIRNQGVTRKGIEIGCNCWIGAKVTVLDGSRVGNGCVIAAGAVVNGIFPDNVVIGGLPAKIIKER